jgi:hypothetical protein
MGTARILGLLTNGSALIMGLTALGFASPAQAAPWTRGYVVGNYDPAWYYGGKPGFTKEGQLEPGSDCPTGSSEPAADLDYQALFSATKWRTPAEVANIVNPPGYETVPNYLGHKHLWQEHELTYRGYAKNINSYMNPWTAADPGQPQVTGKIALGFDLDHNARTGGFTSPAGEKGIDNGLYRAWGCIQAFRGRNFTAALTQRANDKMLEGLYSVVIRLSGNKSPDNDDDVTLEIGYSPDKILKDTDGVGSGYSYRLPRTEMYTKLKATIKNGVVESTQAPEIHMPNVAWNIGNFRDADFKDGKIRLEIDKNGALYGLVGGYRDWRDLYFENVEAQGGATSETVYHQNSLGMYYAIKRLADNRPDPKTGQNMFISTAYRFVGRPAFVLDPAQPMGITVAPQETRYRNTYTKGRQLFFRSIATHKPVGIPQYSPDLHQVERHMAAFPNTDELKKQVNIPVYESFPDDKTPAGNDRQVRNETATTVASAKNDDN